MVFVHNSQGKRCRLLMQSSVLQSDGYLHGIQPAGSSFIHDGEHVRL
jgi:hypothetical protein